MASEQTPEKQAAGFPYLWHMRLRENEQLREAERAKVNRAVDNALNQLKYKYQWKETYLFGSCSKVGKFRIGSDVDIALAGLDKNSLYAFVGDISLLLGRNVDIVLLEECPFADKIRETGVQWKPKNR